MDRLVAVDVKEITLTFKKSHRCTSAFRITNLMHTMSVAVSLTTTSSDKFSFKPSPFSLLPPLSSSTFSLSLDNTQSPPLSSPPETLVVRTSMVPTGKADQEDLRRLFSKPGRHLFKDAAIPISFVGSEVVEFLLVSSSASSPRTSLKTLETTFLLAKAISGCSDSQICTLLYAACSAGNPSFVSALIDAGGDVNCRDLDGKSLLSLAVSSGYVDVVRLLVSAGAQFDEKDRFFHDVVKDNRLDLLQILVNSLRKNGSCDFLDLVDSSGRTPLHVCASRGHVEALKLCVSGGANPNCADFSGWTPLHCAAAEGHLEMVEFLLQCSSYTKYAVTKYGKTPYLLAVDGGHFHLFDALRLGDALHRAATVDDVHGLKSCLSQGANVNGRDQNGWTPLHRAAFKGRIESVKLLLDNGAQVDLVDHAGYTPLQCAVEAEHMQVALYLMGHGAILNSKSFKGVCPVNLDCFINHPAVLLPLRGKKECA